MGLDPSVPQPRRGSIRPGRRRGGRSAISSPRRGSIRASRNPEEARSTTPATRGSIRPGRRRGGRSAISSPQWGSIRASRNREGARSATPATRGSIRPGAPPWGSIRNIEPPMGLDPSVPQPRRGSIHDTGDEGVDPSGAPPWGSIRDIEPPMGLDPSVPQPRRGSIRDTGDEGVDPSGGAAVGGDPRYRAPKWGSIRASRNPEGARCRWDAKSGQKWDPKSGHSSGSGCGVEGRVESGFGARRRSWRPATPALLRKGTAEAGLGTAPERRPAPCESGSWRLATAEGQTPPSPADRTPEGPPRLRRPSRGRPAVSRLTREADPLAGGTDDRRQSVEKVRRALVGAKRRPGRGAGRGCPPPRDRWRGESRSDSRRRPVGRALRPETRRGLGVLRSRSRGRSAFSTG